MLSRRRSAAQDVAAAERLITLLGRERGGWLPPAEWGDAADGEPADGIEAVGPEAAEPDGQDWAAETAADDPAPRSWDGDARTLPRRGLLDLLPVSVRTGRLDPGRRGAAALVLMVLVAALVTGGVLLRGRPQQVSVPSVESSGLPMPGASPSAAEEVVVAVAGTVRRPGLVRLPAGSRVDDALRAAGGPLPGSSTDLLNLARKLVDGEQVLVGVDPPPGAPAGPAGAAAPGGLLDLNTATVTDLDALPGIGPVLAQRIVDWRTENGRFGSVEQLREVTGIGEAKYEDLKAKVTV